MLKKISYKDQIYEYLKKTIVTGELVPGQIYSEQMFADKLNVSRTPVREAVLQLKNEDLLEIFNNRGFGVRPILYEDIRQIIQARTAIEGYSIRQLTESISTPEGLQTLQALTECMNREIEFSNNRTAIYEFMQADVEFHRLLVGFTHNVYFIKTVDMMRTRLEQATVNSLADSSRPLTALQEHAEILSHIKTGNKAKAVAAFEHHMQITEEILKKYMLG